MPTLIPSSKSIEPLLIDGIDGALLRPIQLARLDAMIHLFDSEQ